MLKRPKVGETEEDILEQQAQFLKASGKRSAPKEKVGEDEGYSCKRFEVLSDIKEKNMCIFASRKESAFDQKNGFPNTFVVDPGLPRKTKEKKSLFAIQIEKNKTNINNEIKSDEIVNTSTENQTSNLPACISNNYSEKTIHEENLEKISKMSEKEILEEQKRLMDVLDPSVIKFLKNRNKKENECLKTDSIPESVVEVDNVGPDEEEVKKNLENYIDSKWINIDFLEKEKLEWIGDIPDKKSLDPDQPYSARFDFNGDLQPFTTEIDVRNSLYHHGDEPERPGYTIQELYQLSRSKVLQQRVVALNTLANIIRKTKLGYYDKCFDGQLLHKLVESDLFFLLRFSVDENYLISSSMYCLYNLLWSESDEFCLDKLLGVTSIDEQPLLYNEMETKKDEENELKDHVVIGCDMIKGVLRTDLLVRLAYVLNNFHSTRETVIRVTRCLIRISRHSLEASEKILQTTDLLNKVYSNLKTDTPVYEGVKLFRVIASQSKEMALHIIKKYDINFLVSFIEIEENPKILKKEFYLLKLETIYFWRSLLLHDLFINELVTLSNCLIRLLLFYTQKVDANTENDFDFELFSSQTSLLIVLNKKKISPDVNVVAMMRICLEKWLKQLMQHEQYNYAVCKAIGCIFRFFISYFKSFGVNSVDLDFIKNINSLLFSLFNSNIFKNMSKSLKTYSHILFSTGVYRDPDNLPSLCSVYDGGNEFLRIVQTQSALPLYISLVKYLESGYRITHDSVVIIKHFVSCAEIRNYISKICELKEKINNWFTKYETNFLISFLKLLQIVDDKELLILSFRLLPLLRVDNKRVHEVFEIIFNKYNWKLNVDFIDHLGSLYSEMLLQSRDSMYVLRYKNELIPEEWVYKILGLLRGNEAVVAVKNVLKFINHILIYNKKLIDGVSYTFRYYYLCSVFLTDSNVFDEEIQLLLEKAFNDVVVHSKKINFNIKVDKKKSFYDLYTELITQYAGVSYGLPIFAQFVLFPLQNRFNVSFRKLLWFEYLHVLRVVTLPFPMPNFTSLDSFLLPCETDESLLVAYINSITNNVILKSRNPFVYYIAVGNISTFLNSEKQEEKLLMFIKKKIENMKNEDIKNDILHFSLVNT